jgi:hypothetical protein
MRGSKGGLSRCIYLFASICRDENDTEISVARGLGSQSWFDQYRTQKIHPSDNVAQGLLSFHAIHSNLACETYLSVFWEEHPVLEHYAVWKDRGWGFFATTRKTKCSMLIMLCPEALEI